MAGKAFLMYHELELPGRSLCQTEPGYLRYVLTLSEFTEQMRWLHEAGWRGLNVSQALEYPEEPGVAITFDDGCETDLLVAAPILKQAGFAATFYVTVGFLGKSGYLSPGQLTELAGMDFEIGCHSMTHAYLPDVDGTDLHREIVTAKTELEQILGRPVAHFSCPGGRYDARTIAMAQSAGYRTLATSRAHANSRHTSNFRLGRLAILRNTPVKSFARLCQTKGLRRIQLRDLARGAAKRFLGNSSYDYFRAKILGHSK